MDWIFAWALFNRSGSSSEQKASRVEHLAEDRQIEELLAFLRRPIIRLMIIFIMLTVLRSIEIILVDAVAEPAGFSACEHSSMAQNIEDFALTGSSQATCPSNVATPPKDMDERK